MSSNYPLPLSPARAMAFHQAVEDRDTYIAEQPWQVRGQLGFEENVPRPGCPYCWRGAEVVQWHVLAHEMWTYIEPCGHWFETETPIVIRRTGPGWIVEEEWLP